MLLRRGNGEESWRGGRSGRGERRGGRGGGRGGAATAGVGAGSMEEVLEPFLSAAGLAIETEIDRSAAE